MANEPKLKPCKVCGCNYIRVWERHRSSGNTFHCECEKCKTKTDDVFSKEVAVDEWNKTNETPMPNVNEPTTEEIVGYLRYCGNEEGSCTGCQYTGIDKKGGCFRELSNQAADRLESQQREMRDKDETIADLTANLTAETARADAVLADMKSECHCWSCKNDGDMTKQPCKLCIGCGGNYNLWKWRGAQEGEK